jgi:hypothetical protein
MGYAKQANDDELVRLATRIQIRAVRRCGELLKAIAPAKNQHDARDGSGPGRTQAAADAGLLKRQKDTALRVMDNPPRAAGCIIFSHPIIPRGIPAQLRPTFRINPQAGSAKFRLTYGYTQIRSSAALRL